MIHVHEWKDILFDVIVGCSVAHTFLPPWDAEAIKAFPRFQRVYRLLIYTVGYAAINARSKVYPSISINTPGGVNEKCEPDPLDLKP